MNKVRIFSKFGVWNTILIYQHIVVWGPLNHDVIITYSSCLMYNSNATCRDWFRHRRSHEVSVQKSSLYTSNNTYVIVNIYVYMNKICVYALKNFVLNFSKGSVLYFSQLIKKFSLKFTQYLDWETSWDVIPCHVLMSLGWHLSRDGS